MMKYTKYNEFSDAKSPYVDDGSCLTIYRPHPLATVSLLKLVQSHVDDRVVGIDIRGHRHPRAADILKLKNRCSHGGPPIIAPASTAAAVVEDFIRQTTAEPEPLTRKRRFHSGNSSVWNVGQS